MSRIDARFAKLKAEGKSAFVSFTMAGDPDFDTCMEIVNGLPTAGVDVIELGMPFTDPMADGPSIQLAGQRALAAGQTMGFVQDIPTCQELLDRIMTEAEQIIKDKFSQVITREEV